MTISTNKTKINRRTFISAAAVAPIAGVAGAQTQDPLIAFIEQLESFEDWNMVCFEWSKSWVASELRKLTGLPEQEGLAKEHTQAYLNSIAELKRGYEERQAAKGLAA